jgi:hypothetical protein
MWSFLLWVKRILQYNEKMQISVQIVVLISCTFRIKSRDISLSRRFYRRVYNTSCVWGMVLYNIVPLTYIEISLYVVLCISTELTCGASDASFLPGGFTTLLLNASSLLTARPVSWNVPILESLRNYPHHRDRRRTIELLSKWWSGY